MQNTECKMQNTEYRIQSRRIIWKSVLCCIEYLMIIIIYDVITIVGKPPSLRGQRNVTQWKTATKKSDWMMSCPEAQWLMFSATTFSILLKAIHKHYRCIMYKKCQYAMQTKNPTEWCHQSPKAQCLMFRSTTFSIIPKATHKYYDILYVWRKFRIKCRIQRIKQYSEHNKKNKVAIFDKIMKIL